MEQYGIPGTGMLVTWGYRFYKTNTIAISVILIQHILKIVLFISFYFNSLFFCYVCALPCQTILCAYAQTAIHVFCNCFFFFFFGKQLTVILKKNVFWRWVESSHQHSVWSIREPFNFPWNETFVIPQSYANSHHCYSTWVTKRHLKTFCSLNDNAKLF